MHLAEMGVKTHLARRGAELADDGLIGGGDLEMRSLAGGLRNRAGIEGVVGKFDHGVGQPSLAPAVVVLAAGPRQWFECRAQRRAADRVELAPEGVAARAAPGRR